MFASLMAGISIAVERAVEVIKGLVPALATPWKQNDQYRALILQLLAAALGGFVASQMPNQVKAALPPGINLPDGWILYAVLGLISAGGSGAWNHVLDILGAVKNTKESVANALTLPAAPAPAAAAAAAAGGAAPKP